MSATTAIRRHESSLKSAQKFYGQNFIMLSLVAVKPLQQGWDNFTGVGG